MTPLATEKLQTNFWSKVQKTETCWVWTRAVNSDGYGIFAINRKKRYAHRVSWMHANGRALAPGEYVCHSCDNPPCVRPDHLWIGDQKANMADSAAKGRHAKTTACRKTHCKRGHPLVEGNLYSQRREGRREGRRCKACVQARNNARNKKAD